MNQFKIEQELAYAAYRVEQDEWDQEQISQIEEFAVLEQLVLLQDELEHFKQIDAAQKIEEEDQQQQMQEELTQLQWWDMMPF